MIETSDIFNLAAAFNYLAEIDAGMLDPEQQETLQKMKEKTLNYLAVLIDELPDLSEE